MYAIRSYYGGNEESQKEFLEKSFEFYSENQSNIEFFSWYRQYDRPEGTCVAEQEEIGDVSIELGGGSGLGSSES